MAAAWPMCKSDADLAMRVGVSAHQAWRWRRRQGLPAKAGRFPASQDEFIHAYLSTPGDKGAARKLGCKPGSVTSWRKRNAIPARRTLHDRLARSPRERLRWQTYCLTNSAHDAALILGTSESSVLRWIRRRGLPRHPHGNAKKQAILKAARQGDPIARDAAHKRRWIRPEYKLESHARCAWGVVARDVARCIDRAATASRGRQTTANRGIELDRRS